VPIFCRSAIGKWERLSWSWNKCANTTKKPEIKLVVCNPSCHSRLRSHVEKTNSSLMPYKNKNHSCQTKLSSLRGCSKMLSLKRLSRTSCFGLWERKGIGIEGMWSSLSFRQRQTGESRDSWSNTVGGWKKSPKCTNKTKRNTLKRFLSFSTDSWRKGGSTSQKRTLAPSYQRNSSWWMKGSTRSSNSKTNKYRAWQRIQSTLHDLHL
jgi:hypothetical protein